MTESKGPPGTKAPPRVMRFADLQFVPRGEGGDMAALAEISGSKDGSALGSGLSVLSNARIDWTVRYDEVLIVLEGVLRVHTPEGVMEAGPRDSIWLPAGTAVTYEAEHALLAYAIHPADWAERV